ncbi:MAG: prolipoprotein diacylglyceryl transferase [Oscillospiraceae bacterium]|jgi:phosphatidylglycerol:prolipoprotein diacylglycerol transferase|nr:prolipoprotein diacylglyceryl transferase [Oscillospiraceae bacterium]
MLPAFSLFGKDIGAYSVCAVAGILAAGFFACYQARKKLLDDNKMITVLLFASLGAVIGGSLLYSLTMLPSLVGMYRDGRFTISSFKAAVAAAAYLFGGSVFYGGLIGGIISGTIYMRRKKYDISAYSDLAAPAIPLFHVFGRIGCFLGGCCYGIESKYGFIYTHSLIESANGVRRFPVSLLEAGFNLLLFIFLFLLSRSGRMKGKLLFCYLLIYSPVRFFLEFLRGDEYRGWVLSLSTSQFISILVFFTAAALFHTKLRVRSI